MGIAGSIGATYAGQAVGWYEAGQGAGWIGSIVGAFLLLWIYQKFQSHRKILAAPETVAAARE